MPNCGVGEAEFVLDHVRRDGKIAAVDVADENRDAQKEEHGIHSGRRDGRAPGRPAMTKRVARRQSEALMRKAAQLYSPVGEDFEPQSVKLRR